MKKTITILVILFCSIFITNAQWEQTNLSYSNMIACFTVSGSDIFVGCAAPVGLPGAVFLTTNNGIIWSETGLMYIYVTSFAVAGTNIFAGTMGQGVKLSTNNGANWSDVNSGLPYYVTLNALSLVKSGTSIFVGVTSNNSSGKGLYKSTNNGANWAYSGLINQIINILYVSGTTVFAGTQSTGLYKSTNDGSTWTSIGLNEKPIKCIAASDVNLFVGTVGGGIFRSTNYGTNWIAINNGLPNLDIMSLAVIGSNIFDGSSSGVYFSTNNGMSWSNINQGFGIIPNVSALLIANNYIFAGTNNQSVWRRSLTEIIGLKNISSEIPVEFSLSQNYPNPFNPTTNIKFDIASNVKSEMSNVKLAIYDAIGREIVALVNENLKPGTYEVEWNASDYPSGVYFYRLNTEGFSETRKMILVK